MLTLTIIKPDAVGSGLAGKVLAHLEAEGFVVRALRMTHLSEAEAQAFYEVHRERPFFGSLVAYMTSGPCIPMALERDDAVGHLRTVIGATDPSEAATPRFLALAGPALCWCRTVSENRDAFASSQSPVPSLEPSSTTTI